MIFIDKETVLLISYLFSYSIIMLNYIGVKWTIHLNNKNKACLIDVPFDSSSIKNVIVVFEKADSLDICRRAASEQDDSKFFFWSSNPNPLGMNLTSSCYVFRSCSDTGSTTLTFPGNTYKRCNPQQLRRKISGYRQGIW